MKVLLIVDVQNDFCPGGSLAVPEGDQVVPVINRLMTEGEYDLIVATRDWHPIDHSSFASSHAGYSPFDTIALDGVSQKVWPDHCVENTFGAEFCAGLKTELFDEIFSKGTALTFDSLSGFLDNSKKVETGLRTLIEAHAARNGQKTTDIEIDVTGLAGDICAAETAVDSSTLGFKTRFLIEATRPVNVVEGDDLRAYKKMRDAGVEVISVIDVLPSKSRDLKAEIQLQP